jgi:type VI secretion system secreted protein VgrG
MSDSDSETTTKYTNVTIDPDPGFTLALDELTGTEELGRPFLYVALMSSDKAKGDLMSLLGSSMTISIQQSQDGTKRYFNGYIGRIEYAGLTGGAASYRVELRPWIWLLSHQQDCIIYQNQSPWAIIMAVFQKAGFTDYKDQRQNQAGSTTLDYCVQYDETSFDFVTRLMEEFGIYYYYTHDNGKHTLVFCDDPNCHTSVGDAIPFGSQSTEVRAVEGHIWQWSSELAVVTGTYTYRDYNFTTPSADLTVRSSLSATHPYGTYEAYRYPGLYDTTQNGKPLADLRIQDITARRQITFGASNSRLLYTGCKFTLSGFYEDSENVEYIVVRATYSVAIGEGMATTGGQTRDTFRCTFHAIKGTTQFRLAKLTPRPMIRGPQTAVVVGASGDEICTDQYGRIKVQFPWDRVGTNDQNSSCWIRVAQIWAGQSWGAIFIPRVGQEVVVEFLEGNPDRPIVTGCVYNATQTVPYTLPDNKTRSTIKTNSSTGGNGFNELRFEDKAGSEEVFFQAQKDYNKVVLNNETVNITQDTTTTVKQGNRSITVSQGNNSVTVSQGNNSVTVSAGNDSLTVSQGNHSITVTAGSSTVSAGQSITLKVGSNSITIDNTGVSISAAKFSVNATGQAQVQSGGSMSLQAGASMTIAAPTIALN